MRDTARRSCQQQTSSSAHRSQLQHGLCPPGAAAPSPGAAHIHPSSSTQRHPLQHRLYPPGAASPSPGAAGAPAPAAPLWPAQGRPCARRVRPWPCDAQYRTESGVSGAVIWCSGRLPEVGLGISALKTRISTEPPHGKEGGWGRDIVSRPVWCENWGMAGSPRAQLAVQAKQRATPTANLCNI